ncbi:TRAF family member-associated NF-kappa-B activator isoform X1 [Pantherophis guttatus]|uniref:TRAF family member-associated NF-kappa-B activator isoform X1 n=1 Tax=Pantherophis guttatus TaxID=94885 RepID=A0A6P9CFE8_PANGU|nr:TRAF family member-associated NF-kappa-B activator isoform X1 [Pantherophis guttatus]XP_034282022.1 TRAF family member-associated NF-kappa-B activator isoform X1 [Pantherophis guttatus]XP_034282032.1 TRAF family member-associated NF-kappa-B activator isoform X1 [Pantherophis guttatus]XP_034282042.1 TRAF family member-associated NF-kappa-B activator isoform X1 [Pantherophis guttatus]XP_034282050.1 TRAF family member-associated NF-kappa-B activator isoform X1 [Pantherophis guttatus]
MDKNIAEQLNKAYEAFRQACMERDFARKELKQKTDSYEKQIHEQQEKNEFLMSIVAKLKSQLAANRVNTQSQVPVHEDNEMPRNGTLLNSDFDQLQEKLKLAMQREKLLKQALQFLLQKFGIGSKKKNYIPLEQLESESVKLKKTEEDSNLKEKKFESIITAKEDEIKNLKKQLKEINEAQNCVQVSRYEKEARSEKHPSSRQELSSGVSSASVCERDELESVFWGMKEEFSRIRALARAQTDQLNKCNLRREPTTEIPFSKPIQCTDEQTDDLCNPWVKKDTNRDVPHFSTIASRGMGPDEEENSVESLSKLNVKFPPTDSDTEFLESSPETTPILNALMTENMLPNQPFNMDHGDQEPPWNSYCTQGTDLLALASEDSELSQSGICEFCQKVFPPSLTSREDFLRHLNSHFNLKS